MTSTHPLTTHAAELLQGSEGAEAAEMATEEALVAQARTEKLEPLLLNPVVAGLPVELDVAIPVRSLKVRNLLALERGSLIETQWSNGDDLPLCAGAVQLVWSEFEVVDSKLAVRVTRLA